MISQNIGARGVHVWETGIWTPTYFCGFTSVFNRNQCLHKHVSDTQDAVAQWVKQ